MGNNNISKYISRNECASWMNGDRVNSCHYVWKRRKLVLNTAKEITVEENCWLKDSTEKWHKRSKCQITLTVVKKKKKEHNSEKWCVYKYLLIYVENYFKSFIAFLDIVLKENT